MLPLDDFLHALKRFLHTLARSSLRRFYPRHGINTLPCSSEPVREKNTFKCYPLAYLHIDITEVHTAEGRAYLFVAVDRTSKFVYAEFHEQRKSKNAVNLLEAVLKTLPYKEHTVLTDNDIQFTKSIGTESYRSHPFNAVCHQHGIKYRLTKPFHPWASVKVERINRTIKQATIKAFHYARVNSCRTI